MASYYPSDITEIKIFILFLLDSVRGPIESADLDRIISENIADVTLAYSEALTELTDRGHVIYDEIDRHRYYMISDAGRAVSRELYTTLPELLRDDVTESVSRYVALTNDSLTLSSRIAEREGGDFSVELIASDERGEFLRVNIAVPSRDEAARMVENFKRNPSGVYRGFLFSLTGRLEYLH